MALALSPLSQVCKGIRVYLDGEINAPARSKVTVLLATPADAASASAGDTRGVAAWKRGMAVYTLAKGGLMYEASIGGQKFNFKPKID